jgi:hypothetical protein
VAEAPPKPVWDIEDKTRFVQEAIDDSEMSWQLLLELSRLRHSDDGEMRALGDRFPRALASFEAQHPRAEVGIFSPIGGVYLLEDGELNCTFGERPHFDWSEAWPLILEIEMLAEEAKEWWPPGDDAGRAAAQRRPHSIRAFGLATWVLTAIRDENERHPDEQPDELREPSSVFRSALATYWNEVREAKRRFRVAAQRTAQSRYWRGTLYGAAALAALCAILGLIFWWRGVDAAYGIALLTGGLGAMVSLLQRMSSGKLTLDIDASRDLLEVFGAMRPFIGAVFGLAVMALLLGGLIPAIEVPSDQKLAFFAGVGFLAGFNERWAQDMLKSPTTQMGGPSSAPKHED